MLYKDLYRNACYFAAVPYGMTDTMGRMHSDAQCAGTPVSAHGTLENDVFVREIGVLTHGNSPGYWRMIKVPVGTNR